ncbi:hypothetical protein BCR36DRAFT_416642 [Piromyces finnis]|uniref:Uncharacterized protein n=1 Tax=Piromyces finnis TaxID=1754191 RepID=A0A1Y1UUE7_9FUNG|nr:hypothetical protein BCR36DRAFT_416642 [Piromyces finnis]|eukprot:ORX41649.1 hypothetical protein BCR36DRAFT_416642 [Piromyces finnis]
MTIKYIKDNEIDNISNLKVKENNLNIQYNSDFISNSQIDLKITNYSIYIYESQILLWYDSKKKGILIEAEDLVFHALSSSDNNAEREGNFPYLYLQILLNEQSMNNLSEVEIPELEEFKNAIDAIEIYILTPEYKNLEILYDEIANLLNNFDSKIQKLNNLVEENNNDENEKVFNKNNFGDILIELSTKDSLNPKEWYFGDVPFEDIQLTAEGQTISDRLEKMLENDINFEGIDIEKKELDSEEGQFDNAEEY